MQYGAIIQQGWRGFARNAWVLVGFALVYALVIGLISWLTSLVSSRIIEADTGTGSLWLLLPYLLLLLLQVVVHLLGHVALLHGGLLAAKGQTFKFTDLFDISAEIFNLLGFQVFALVAILFGLLAFGIPGIYLAVAYWFGAYVLVDRRVAFLDAMAISRALVTARWFDIAALLLVIGGISLLGLLACGVGLFATTPLAVCIGAAAYLELSAEQT
jgi:hypothetical protein